MTIHAYICAPLHICDHPRIYVHMFEHPFSVADKMIAKFGDNNGVSLLLSECENTEGNE